MNQPISAFSRITQTSGRINSLLFVVLPLLLVLLTALFWGAERIVEQEKRRLEVDFSSFIGYLREQETFLWALKKQNQDLSQLIESRTYALQYQKIPSDWPLTLLEGKESVVAMPFTLACDKHLECSHVPSVLYSLGAYLADFYSSFWGASYFPAAAVFFVNTHNSVSISVPSVGTLTGNESITPTMFRVVTETVRRSLPQLNTQFSQNQQSGSPDKIIWIHTPELGDNLIGIVPAGFDANLWKGAQLFPEDIYAITLLNRERISVLERILNPTLTHRFWLLHQEYGQLLGTTPAPNVLDDGLHYTRDGVLLKLHNKTNDWVGYYLIGYAAFFDDNLWLPVSVLAALLFSLFCGWGYQHWYRRYILHPAVEAQQNLLSSETFNRALIETTPIGLCVIAKENSQILLINPLARRWLKLTPSTDLQTSQEYQYFLSVVITATQESEFSPFILGENTFYINYIPIKYQQQEVILCAFTNMSTQAEIEDQLTQAKLAAEEANSAKSTFLTTMSHEIRTPLYGLMGTLELFTSTSLTPQQEQYIQRMTTASKLLMHIIGDILDISKIEANQLRLHPQSFNLFDAIQSTLQMYSGVAQQKNLLLFSCIDPQVIPERLGDAPRLQQILGNLLSNAIKFTRYGTIIIHVGAQSLEENTLIITVADTGIGLTCDQQKKLFEPFYQAHTEHHTYGGTGLGLFICQRLIHLMDGTLHVDSQINVGSKFTVTLPLPATKSSITWPNLINMNIWLQTPHPALTKNIEQWLTYWGAQVWLNTKEPAKEKSYPVCLVIASSSPSLPSDWKEDDIVIHSTNFNLTELGKQLSAIRYPDLHGSTPIDSALPQYHCYVLVVEDNPINQVVLQEQLQQLGCEVLLADDGEYALALWDSSERDIDLVLTDINMPYLNGYELTQQLRAEGATCPIIGVTANGLKEEEERCLTAGMNAWLIKPINLNTLTLLLGRYFTANSTKHRNNERQHANPLLGNNRAQVISHLEDDIDQIKQTITHHDVTRLLQVSHRLRGALVTVQQPDLAARLRTLEIQLAMDTNNRERLHDFIAIYHDLQNWVTKLNQKDDEPRNT